MEHTFYGVDYSNRQWGTVNFSTQKVEKIVTYPLALTEKPFVIVATSNSQYYPSWFTIEVNRVLNISL